MRWEMDQSFNKDYIFQSALSKGWATNEVQVKMYQTTDWKGNVAELYTIEPFEEDCQCPNLVPYPQGLTVASHGGKVSRVGLDHSRGKEGATALLGG